MCEVDVFRCWLVSLDQLICKRMWRLEEHRLNARRRRPSQHGTPCLERGCCTLIAFVSALRHAMRRQQLRQSLALGALGARAAGLSAAAGAASAQQQQDVFLSRGASPAQLLPRRRCRRRRPAAACRRRVARTLAQAASCSAVAPALLIPREDTSLSYVRGRTDQRILNHTIGTPWAWHCRCCLPLLVTAAAARIQRALFTFCLSACTRCLPTSLWVPCRRHSARAHRPAVPRQRGGGQRAAGAAPLLPRAAAAGG